MTRRLPGGLFHDVPTSASRYWDRPTAAVFLAYCVLEAALLLNHQSFRDEAQAWLWAQQVESWRDFLVIPYEGHPPVWYWILRLVSAVLSFSEARWLQLPLAALNALLLARLTAKRPLLYALVLLTPTVAFYWGIFFRPYTLILTLLLGALLAHRAKRPVLGTWLLAIACGLQFFAGFIFAFWLLFQLRERVALRQLVPPSLLALLFGALAVLSAMGNPLSDHDFRDLVLGSMRVFAAPFKIASEPWIIWFAVMSAVLAKGFWHDKYLLAILALSLAGFCTFNNVVYGPSAWHIGFMLFLVLSAFFLDRHRGPIWPIVVFLVPQAMIGLATSGYLLVVHLETAETAFQAVTRDAGVDLAPETNLIAWPEYALSAPSALNDFKYVSGDTGQVIGPFRNNVDRMAKREISIHVFADRQTPYWLVCLDCDDVLRVIADAGLSAKEVFPPTAGARKEAFAAYRVERK